VLVIVVVVLDKHIRIWWPDLANVGEFKANRKKRPKLELPRCWRVPPGSWILAPDSFPSLPERLRLGLKRVFYNLDLNQVRFTGNIVRRASHDGKDVAGLRLQNFRGGLSA
jgi:hypothetical protein